MKKITRVLSDTRVPGYLPGTRVTGIETGTRVPGYPFRALVVSASIEQVPARPARIRSHIATSDKLIKLDLHRSWPQLRWENLPTPARR